MRLTLNNAATTTSSDLIATTKATKSRPTRARAPLIKRKKVIKVVEMNSKRRRLKKATLVAARRAADSIVAKKKKIIIKIKLKISLRCSIEITTIKLLPKATAKALNPPSTKLPRGPALSPSIEAAAPAEDEWSALLDTLEQEKALVIKYISA